MTARGRASATVHPVPCAGSCAGPCPRPPWPGRPGALSGPGVSDWIGAAVAGLDRDETVPALGEAYQGLASTLEQLGEAGFLLPTRCAGWTISDCLYHLLGDARRALAAFATPASSPPDGAFISYWRSSMPAEPMAAESMPAECPGIGPGWARPRRDRSGRAAWRGFPAARVRQLPRYLAVRPCPEESPAAAVVLSWLDRSPRPSGPPARSGSQ